MIRVPGRTVLGYPRVRAKVPEAMLPARPLVFSLSNVGLELPLLILAPTTTALLSPVEIPLQQPTRKGGIDAAEDARLQGLLGDIGEAHRASAAGRPETRAYGVSLPRFG